jgi:nucleotide-binding universal stress UspA family protein
VRKKRIAFHKQRQVNRPFLIDFVAMKKMNLRNILVPIDFSKMSIKAIETAKRLGQRFGATIHLAHVHHWQYPADFVGPVLSSGFLPESFQEDRNRQLANSLKASRREPDFLRRNKRTSEQARLHFMKFANLHRKFLLI